MATAPPARRLFGCPFCGQAITGSEDRCRRCGGTFSDTTRFECPFCSEFVSPHENKCPSCGIDFLEFLTKTLHDAAESDVDRLLEELGNLSAHAEGPKPTGGAVCPFCGVEVTGVEPFCPNCRVSFLAGMFLQCPTCGAKMRGDALDCPVCATHFSKPLEIEREGRVERIDLERLPLAEKELETYGLREPKEIVVTTPGQRIFKPQYKVSREEEREQRETIREELPVQELPLPVAREKPAEPAVSYRRLAERRPASPPGGAPSAAPGAPAVVRVRTLKGTAARPPRSPSGPGESRRSPAPPSKPNGEGAGAAGGTPASRAPPVPSSDPLKSLVQLFSWPKEQARPSAPRAAESNRYRKLKGAPAAPSSTGAGRARVTPQGPGAPRRPIVLHLCPACHGALEPHATRCPHCGILFDTSQ